MIDDDPFLASLLFQAEGSSLDFKREQYLCATNEEKSELIKDILAFANAWRHSDAYILIGVAENPGNNATVVGVTCHLRDADLQQLVNSKTNQPVAFSYRSARLDGKDVGILHVPSQERPRFITKQFGRLKADTVYIRRGSSTVIARPDEIARMGAAHTSSESPVIQLQFADTKHRELTGDKKTIHSKCLNVVDIEQIPDFVDSTYLNSIIRKTNPDYLRELAHYKMVHNLCTPLHFAITNSGPATAMDVRAELVVKSPHAVIFDGNSWPHQPDSYEDPFAINISQYSALKDDHIAVHQLSDRRSIVEISAPKIQPKESIWIESVLYLGAISPGKIILEGKIRADNIAIPQATQLIVNCTTEHHSTTWRQLLNKT